MKLLQIIHLLSALLLILAGALVLIKKRFSYYSRPFLFFILVNLSGIAAINFGTGQNPSLWFAGYILLYFYVSFLPFAWFFVASRWGIDRSEYSRKKVILSRVFLLVSAIIAVWLWAERGVDLSLIDNRWFLDLCGWHKWINGFLIICLTTGAYFIEVCYRSSLGLSRIRIKRSFFPFLAYAIGLLAMATVGLLYGMVSDWMMAIMFLLASLVGLPLTRHYILFNPTNDGIILTKKGVYSSIVIVLFGIYFLILGTVGELLTNYDLDEGLFYTVVVLVLVVITFMILVLSQAVRFRIKPVSETRTPFRSKGLYAEEWKEFAEEVSVTLSIDAVYERTSQLLHRLLKIDKAVFIIKEPAPSEDYILYSGDGIDRGIPGEQIGQLADWLYRFGHPVEADTLRDKTKEEKKQLDILETTVPFRIFLLVPFVARQKMLGFWGIGAHSTDRELTSDEIGFIEAAANPVALTILGARMTDELLISREIESFHRFSSFVLHDLKNSVAMLSMLMQNAEKNIGNPEFQKEALVTIRKAVDRQKKIISRLTEDKTNGKLSLEETSLAELIRKTLERVRLETAASVSLKLEVDDGLRVYVDPDKIGSVFDNLVINAIEAMPDGGILEIKSVESDSPGMIAVSFKDSGAGMEQEFISTRLFKPFNSTKPHGLGIGMYQSQEIIKVHQGRMVVASEPGRGTEFVIYLPGEG